MLKERTRPRPSSPRSEFSASVLGRLLVMQSVVGTLPDERSIFSFVCRGLLDVPGVVEASYVKSPGETTGALLRRFPIMSGNCTLGELLVNISDPAAFAPYESYVENFSVMVSVILEERHQRQLNQLHQMELEGRVQDRTADLARANAALRVEVTERKRAEAALRELSRKNEEALRIAHMGRWEFDANSGQFTFNDQYYTLHGITAAQAGGYQMSAEEFARKYVHPDDAHLVQESIQKAAASDDPGFQFETEARILRADGEVRTVFCWFRIEKDAQGATVKLHGVNQDITERKQAEAELTQHREHLEELVAARTADLQMANRDLESFSYSVSHDLRAPLRAIDGCAQVLREDFASSLEQEGQRTLGLISDQTKRMNRLIDDLLAFSRLGRQSMQAANIDMNALAQEVFREQSALNPKHTVELRISLLPPALGDRAMIRVVLNNLFSNAIKYSRGRTPPLIVMGGSLEPAQNLYFVKDNGVGFDMKYVDKLFGVFQRLHAATEFEGNGVGLALVQRIIHRHGGRVWAEAKPNEGATFHFSLPAQRTEA